ncbi:RNA-binding protein 5-A-like isoform X1 [Drosophila elegans]|uniref:RNA-binding protein 5-A-like isoform X1 n=1 Tax=Drosophila elegans TaxID=30023 RepID=UPI0007E73E43|nr:RNA-binding protein 5-A-like isoform X1 [Drosophila elegans]
MDSRNRRSFSGGSGNEGGRGSNYYRSRPGSRYSRSRSRSRERNRSFGGYRHRNSRSRSRDRSPVFRQDHRGGRGGNGDPDLYHSLINDDYREDQRNYNPRNNFDNRQFRREDSFDRRNHRSDRECGDSDREQNDYEYEQRCRDLDSRESRHSMERGDRGFPDRGQSREQSRPWNRNFSHDDRGRSNERNTRPREQRFHNGGGNHNMPNHNRERERDWDEDRDRDQERDRDRDRERRGSSDYDSDEGHMRRNKYRGATEALNIIIIFGLTKEMTRADIMSELIKVNMEPACIRIIRKHGTDSSRGIAFVEFNTVEEAKQWMEITQGVLKLNDQRVSMRYSHKRIQDWNCNKCGVCNFKFRFYCFVCKTSREDSETTFSSGSEGVDEVSAILTKKIMLRNLDALTNEEGVLTALQQHLPVLSKTVSKVLISRDTLTQASRGICYLNFDTLVDSMNVHNALTSLDPPLTLDDRLVAVTYCNDLEERQAKPKDPKATTAKAIEPGLPSGDISAVPPSGLGGSYTLADVPRLAEYSASLYASNPAEHAHYVQYYTEYYTADISKKSDPHVTEANSGAAVALSAIQRKQKKMNSIETTITAAATAAAQAAAEVKATFAAQGVSAPRGNDGKTYPTPDVTQYQYDETSGYYYDRSTGLYYDAHSQYYYNNETGAYLYWDQRRSTYVLATPASTQAALQEVLAEAEQKEDEAKKAKEKEKDKEGGNKHDKVKVAKKIVKDMEKWAKQLNQKKDYTAVATPQPILANEGPSTSTRGNQGGYADVGFSILEKKERGKLNDYVAAPGPMNKLVNAYGGASDSEEESAANFQNAQGSAGSGVISERSGGAEESDYVDLQKLTCLLCKRAFQSLEILQKHLKMSNLHKENLAKLNQNSAANSIDEALSYRDRAKERRLKYGESDPPPPNRSRERFEQEIKTLQKGQKDASGNAPAMPISSSNVGSRLLQKMGWSEGQGLGRKNQGRTQIIEADGRTNNVGLGNKSGQMIPGNDYKSYIKKMMKQRYENA